MATRTYLGQTLINRAYIGATQHNIFSDVAPSPPVPLPTSSAPDEITSATLLAWYDYSSYTPGNWQDKSGNGYHLIRTGSGDSAVDNSVLFINSSAYFNTSSAVIDAIGGIKTPFSYIAFFKPIAGQNENINAITNAVSASEPSPSVAGRYYPFGISKIASGSLGIDNPFSGSLEVDPPFNEEVAYNFYLTSSQWEMITVNPTALSGSEYIYNKNTLVTESIYYPLIETPGPYRPGFHIAGDGTSLDSPFLSGSIGAVCIYTGSISQDDIQRIYLYYSSSYGYA